MAQDNQQDDPGTDPETQRQALIRRSKVAHAPDEPPFVPATTREPDGEQADEPKKQAD
jgi:hypothetical protein